MLPDIGQASLLIAIFFAVLSSAAPLLVFFGSQTENWNRELYRAVRRLSFGQCFFISLALICLGGSFLANDFSVKYVASHSNVLLPTQYKVSAIWGGHEGSLLLWVWILAVWVSLLALNAQKLPLNFLSTVLSVLSMVMVGFLAFIIFTSDPFERLLPDFPLDGQDLNPLLQDIGLIVHPPMLYMGYVGLALPFAFAIAGLMHGEFDRTWASWSRPWAKAAWAFLTIGIALGSWWAYYELGWGGWWFWDPVENASFMPWLAGAALIHSLLATEKRQTFKVWTVLLSIVAFSLSLLGTFLVRSGVLTSVHAFASDPARGMFILAFLGLVVGGSLLLFALRAERLKSEIGFSLLSKEFFLILNNIFLLVACATVLLGTLFPIFSDVFDLGRVSIGPPYFNSLFFPMTVLLLIAMALAPLLNWRDTQEKDRLIKSSALFFALAVALSAGVTGLLLSFWDWKVFLMLSLLLALAFLLLASLNTLNPGQLWTAWRSLSVSQKNMHVAHFGLAVSIFGIALTSIYSDERDLSLAKGESVQLSDYVFRFEGVETVRGPNYIATRGRVAVEGGGTNGLYLLPEKRKYFVQEKPMTEAAIDGTLTRDLYVALGEDLGADKWSLRVYHKPFVRMIWFGALIMALSCFFYLWRTGTGRSKLGGAK